MIRDDKTAGRRGKKEVEGGSCWKEGERRRQRHDDDDDDDDERERESKGREREKAWCNGGTSLRVSALHQRSGASEVVDARTMPLGERRTATEAEGPA